MGCVIRVWSSHRHRCSGAGARTLPSDGRIAPQLRLPLHHALAIECLPVGHHQGKLQPGFCRIVLQCRHGCQFLGLFTLVRTFSVSMSNMRFFLYTIELYRLVRELGSDRIADRLVVVEDWSLVMFCAIRVC